MFFSFEKTWIPFTQGCFVTSLVEIGPWFWRRRFLKFVNVFSLFCNYLPLEKVGLFIWTNLNSIHQRMHCAKFGWNWPSCSGEDFQISSMYFRYFVMISLWKRAWPFIWTNLNPLFPRMLCSKFGWNLPRGSGEEDL